MYTLLEAASRDDSNINTALGYLFHGEDSDTYLEDIYF
jgi:hypothetical protein